MLRPKLLGAAVLAVVASASARTARAQATVGADLGLFSGYVWRGVSLTNRPVGQPNVYVAFPAGNASVTVGGWANVDLGRYDDSRRFQPERWGVEPQPVRVRSLGGGERAGRQGDAHRRRGGLRLSQRLRGRPTTSNTWEVYGKVGLGVPLSPKLAVYYDVDKVNGAYLEGSVGHSVPLGSVSLNLGRARRLQRRARRKPMIPDELNNFVENGFTHLDLSAGVPLSAGIFSITPVLHFLVNGDQTTKFTSPGDESDVKLWGGLTISWSRALGAATASE